jgi:hypothetical protein
MTPVFDYTTDAALPSILWGQGRDDFLFLDCPYQGFDVAVLPGRSCFGHGHPASRCQAQRVLDAPKWQNHRPRFISLVSRVESQILELVS